MSSRTPEGSDGPKVAGRRRRDQMELRFGRLGTGAHALTVAGTRDALPELLVRLGLAFEGGRSIDGVELGLGHFAIRDDDPDEPRIAADEFDGEFRCLGETRVHVAEWVGEPWSWTSS